MISAFICATAFLLLALMACPSVAGSVDSSPFFVEVQLSGHGVAAEASSFTLECLPQWAPLGAARFRELVEDKFYDDQRFFRVLDGDYNIFIAQFGLHGDPAVSAQWERRRIPDDPRGVASNGRGTLAFAMSGPGTRTTQLFLNFRDSSAVLDKDFAPFARVVAGMDAIESIYKSGEGISQGRINQEGNSFLDRDHPKLTRIETARLVAAYDGVREEL